MKKYLLIVGIDVSKSKLDVAFILNGDTKKIDHFIVANDLKAIKSILSKAKRFGISEDKILFCFENTGTYSMPLCYQLSDGNFDYWVIPPIEIAKSKGLTRGKNDKTDSKDIALYAITHSHKIKLNQLPEKDIIQLRLLYTERSKVMKAIKLMATSQEYSDFYPKQATKDLLSINQKLQKHLQKALTDIERKIQLIIRNNDTINKQIELIKSIPGVGQQTALYMVITTKCFSTFQNWRQIACYAGVAPFEYSSGSSIRGRAKVNHYADKQMKSLLNMCALTAKKYDYQMKVYFERKVADGKNKMLVLNNIRCKLISRIFAVINREQPYINTAKFAA
jgi:transposase